MTQKIDNGRFVVPTTHKERPYIEEAIWGEGFTAGAIGGAERNPYTTRDYRAAWADGYVDGVKARKNTPA